MKDKTFGKSLAVAGEKFFNEEQEIKAHGYPEPCRKCSGMEATNCYNGKEFTLCPAWCAATKEGVL